MAISPSNVVVLYREDSDESFDFAQYYANFRGLSPLQLIPLPCSGDEILTDYNAFKAQIENPLFDQLADEYVAELNPWVIVVGFGVPGGFHQGGNIISTQSRLSRIYHEPSWGVSNPIFARTTYKPYDASDADNSLIVSRIDAPTLADAKAMVDGIRFVQRRSVANGRFMFDKYAPIDLDEYGQKDRDELNYSQDLNDFETITLPILNMVTYRTTYWDENTDVVIPRGVGDSFFWAWKADRTGYTFFQDTTKSRIFLYNADNDGGASMRDAEDKRWPMIALSSGYAASAGAMSDPLPEGYLRPKPFFDALFRGATIGEAFLTACPNLDWTLGLFGDPLISVKFPNGVDLGTGYSLPKGFAVMNRQLQDSIGYKSYGDVLVKDAYNSVFATNDVFSILDIAPSVNRLKNAYSQTTAQYARVVAAFENFPTASSSFGGFLQNNNIKISKVVIGINPSLSLPSDVQLDSLSWYFETPIVRISSEYNVYQFELQVSNTDDFTSPTLSLSTNTSKTGWSYEKEDNSFSPVPDAGISSSFAGRRVRFTATPSQYFTSQSIYYVRFRQINEFSDATDWLVVKQVIGT